MDVLDINAPPTWPSNVRGAAERTRAVFDAWFNDGAGRSAKLFDAACVSLAMALQPHALKGWHLSRLLPHEVDEVKRSGLAPLSVELIERKIRNAISLGVFDDRIGASLLSRHQAHQGNRSAKIWFGFNNEIPGQRAAEALLRYWGGEALYWAHQADSEVGTVIRSVGTPVLIDAAVPVQFLANSYGLVEAVARSDLAHAGLHPMDEYGFEHYATQCVPGEMIKGVTQHPEAEFIRRVRSDRWSPPL